MIRHPLGECFFFGMPYSQETRSRAEKKILTWILEQEGFFPEDYYFTVSFRKKDQTNAVECDVEVRIGSIIWKGRGVSVSTLGSLDYGLASMTPSTELPDLEQYEQTIHALKAC